MGQDWKDIVTSRWLLQPAFAVWELTGYTLLHFPERGTQKSFPSEVFAVKLAEGLMKISRGGEPEVVASPP